MNSKLELNRRQFITTTGTTLLGATFWSGKGAAAENTPPGGSRLSWHRLEPSRLFDRVSVDGQPLLNPEAGAGLFDGFARLLQDGQPGVETVLGGEKTKGQSGPIQLTLRHTLTASADGTKEDLIEATLTLRNTSDRPQEVLAGFLTGVRPKTDGAIEQTYLPLSASALGDPTEDKRNRLKDCLQLISKEGLVCHYLEPQASDPRAVTTRAPLLVPVVDRMTDGGLCRVALFGLSTEPMYFESQRRDSAPVWRMARRLRLEPGQERVMRGFLLVHFGDATEAWRAFHRFAHKEDFPACEWARRVRVHYFDFLSAVEAKGPRGGGYDLDLTHFNEFQVGMATQHGYYLSYGDFVHPDRREWKAMPKDEAGPVPMTLEKIRERVKATRRAGAHPAIYMHYTILDEGSPLFKRMEDSILVDASGKPTHFGWEGPDVIKTTWRMSHASPAWRDHLVQQAQWLMELFNPDALVLDETFTAWGWDHHKQHGGALSQGGIELMRKLRSVVRSFGPDKALFASDCSMSNFCLWGDGDGGDHCYDRLLGHEFYRKPPIRYMSALGDKAWLPCAWLYRSLWPAQVDLARKTGAAVGVTNGWGDSLGLTRLPEEAKKQMLQDIAALGKP
jgi:hypothetical protein